MCYLAVDGSTALHDAAYSGTAQMVALLLSLGCNGLIKVSICNNVLVSTNYTTGY